MSLALSARDGEVERDPESHGSSSAPLPLSGSSPLARLRPSSGFRDVDRCLRTPADRGLVYVEGRPRALDALEKHLARKARALGRKLVRAGGAASADAWHDLAVRLGLGGCPDPRTAADQIAASAEGAVLVVREGAVALWGRAVADEMAREVGAGGCLAFVLTERAPIGAEGRVFELGSGLSAEELRLWWQAVAADPGEVAAPAIDRLEDLDGWWCAARATPADAGGPAAPEVVAEVDGGLALAEALEARAGDDPWAAARASELFAAAGLPERADRAASLALSGAFDPTARADFWRRYERMIALYPSENPGARRLWAAAQALRFGDVDRSLDFAHAAAGDLGDTFATAWTLGCALCARGDLTTAEIALGKAFERAPDVAARARTAVRMAEVRYLMGDFAAARRLADEGIRDAAEVATRLAARNVIGKLHLAAAAWAEADRHFAEDAFEAARAGDRMSELRARLNRAIALLMFGRRDEAHGMLVAIVDEGERHGEPQAVSRALHNLATAAHRRGDYAEALQRYRQALNVAQRLHEKIPFANLIVAFTELQLRLNLVREAEQTLAFGRKACGSWMPGVLMSDLSIVAARVHLACGRTSEAADLVRQAASHVGSSRNGDSRSHCPRLWARIALEEGDLQQVERSIAAAREVATTSEAPAEIALLDAMRARAAGQPFEEATLVALKQARDGAGVELSLEAHLLLARSTLDRRDLASARTHAAAAAALRDRMAAMLPDEIQARFLQRPDLVALASIEARLREAPAARLRVMGKPAMAPPGGLALAGPERIFGEDPAMVTLRSRIQKVASTDVTVLVLGESGTGKELVADALHEASARVRRPLVKVNCAALVETLLLSELFGHEKGAFTGATARRLGRFEVADGGTLFLDEIGDISPRTQTALLRVLQEKTFERVGGTVTLRTDCRVVCATHRNLKAMVERGEFREDLYYRLQGFVLQVPPLRQRLSDLPLLAETIALRIATERGEPVKKLSPEALAGLAHHTWPGNVRELDNALRATTLFASDETLQLEDFIANVEGLRGLSDGVTGAASPDRAPPAVSSPPAEAPAPPPPASPPAQLFYQYILSSGVSLGDMKRELERECIGMALAERGGNITRAGELLGMKRSRMSQLVSHYGFRAVSADLEETES